MSIDPEMLKMLSLLIDTNRIHNDTFDVVADRLNRLEKIVTKLENRIVELEIDNVDVPDHAYDLDSTNVPDHAYEENQ